MELTLTIAVFIIVVLSLDEARPGFGTGARRR